MEEKNCKGKNFLNKKAELVQACIFIEMVVKTLKVGSLWCIFIHIRYWSLQLRACQWCVQVITKVGENPIPSLKQIFLFKLQISGQPVSTFTSWLCMHVTNYLYMTQSKKNPFNIQDSFNFEESQILKINLLCFLGLDKNDISVFQQVMENAILD